MKLIPASLCAFALVASAFADPAFTPSPDYRLTVDGKPALVYHVPTPEVRLAKKDRHPYAYAPLTSAAESVEIAIESETLDLSKAEVLPASKGVRGRFADGRLTFRMKVPEILVVETTGRFRSLVIATSRPEANPPREGDAGVRFFGPGVHHPEVIRLKSNETLYLAPGAWVEGIVAAVGDNITVCGSGVLSGACWPWKKGPIDKETNINPAGHLIAVKGNGFRMRDVTAFSSFGWTTVLNGVTNAVIENYKIIGGRCVNDDGVDVCKTKDVTIRNSFIRTQDDCIAPKWWCENLTVSNCTFVTDESNLVRIGYECVPGEEKRGFRHLVFKNIDGLHLAMAKRTAERYWCNCALLVQASHGNRFEDILFENIRLKEFGEGDVFFCAKTMSIKETDGPWFTTDGGYIRGITVRNPSAPVPITREMLHCIAKDPQHPVEDVRLE